MLEQPVEPHRWNQPIYAPVQAGGRFYLSILEADSEGEGDLNLQFIIEKTLRLCRAIPDMPPELRLLDVEDSEDLVRLNLNGVFKNLFPEKGTDIDVQISSILLDSLFLTAFENSRVQKVEVLVEGERWTPPEGYPSLTRYVRRPFHINPE